jgi:phosphoribosylglycinamide formyltransferase-1
MKNLVILISGRGSNMEAIVRASSREAWPARVVAVIANRPEAAGLAFAAAHGIATAVVDHRQFPDRESFDAALAREIDGFAPDLVVLAGFMRILGEPFLRRFGGRTVNTHPALLPAFPGAHGVRDALAYGVKVTGCTVIIVDPGVDSGPVVAQRAVPVEDGDDEACLHERIKVVERELLVDVVGRMVTQGWSVDGRRVVLGGAGRVAP